MGGAGCLSGFKINQANIGELKDTLFCCAAGERYAQGPMFRVTAAATSTALWHCAIFENSVADYHRATMVPINFLDSFQG